MARLPNKSTGILLEAEVAPGRQRWFENRYSKATGQFVSPGSPKHYQAQPNKWGAELRAYFNHPGLAKTLSALGMNVESSRRGYLSGKYAFRINDNRFWWRLIDSGLRLGRN